jgi:hypothetical protein
MSSRASKESWRKLFPKPGDIAAASAKNHKKSLQFIETLFTNAGGDDLKKKKLEKKLEDVPPERRYAHMPKPWKGRNGRVAARGVTTKTKLSKKEQAIELRRQGHTEVQIGEIIERNPRQVRRYLNGR